MMAFYLAKAEYKLLSRYIKADCKTDIKANTICFRLFKDWD